MKPIRQEDHHVSMHSLNPALIHKLIALWENVEQSASADYQWAPQALWDVYKRTVIATMRQFLDREEYIFWNATRLEEESTKARKKTHHASGLPYVRADARAQSYDILAIHACMPYNSTLED
jgi:hypothetical protein